MESYRSEDRLKFNEARPADDHARTCATLVHDAALASGHIPIVSRSASLMQTDARQEPVLILHTSDRDRAENPRDARRTASLQVLGQPAGVGTVWGVRFHRTLRPAMIGFCGPVADAPTRQGRAGALPISRRPRERQIAAPNLVRQLPALSRRQTLSSKTSTLTDLLAELSNLIRRLIAKRSR